MYKLLYNALKAGGRLAVHQGGDGSYKGLHDIVRQAAENIGVAGQLKDWTFPVFYPTKEEMEKLLLDTGFTQISVESVYSDGSEYEHLIDNFEGRPCFLQADAKSERAISPLWEDIAGFALCRTLIHRLTGFISYAETLRIS